MEEWVTIIVALGGFKLIEFLYDVVVNHVSKKRRNTAAAAAAEIDNFSKSIRTLAEQLEKEEARLELRDKKVDFLFSQLESERVEKLKSINSAFEWERRFYETRCEIDDCKYRMPPKMRKTEKNGK